MKSNNLQIKWMLQKGICIMLGIGASLLVGALILVGVLLVWSHGKPQAILDKTGEELPGSISEKIYISVNGVEQGMFIKGTKKDNPVLLFLHGGPGMPEQWLNQQYPSGLENYFTVCWWEQRGAGLSYHSDIPAETMTREQLIDDAVEVTNYLRHRFGQEKIYLMGHSWGSYLGMYIAERAPELYHAYIGIAQMARQFESEKLAYTYMMEQFKKSGNTKMVQRLEKFPITKMDAMPDSYGGLRDEAMHSLGIGTTRHMKSVISGIFLPVMQSPEYTLREKINIWRGKAFCKNATNLWQQMMTTDLTVEVPKVNIPVYFFHGKYDYTDSYTEAKAYFHKLKAPIKGFYSFEESAHSPLFEEPQKMQHILQEDVLLGKNDLADMK